MKDSDYENVNQILLKYGIRKGQVMLRKATLFIDSDGYKGGHGKSAFPSGMEEYTLWLDQFGGDYADLLLYAQYAASISYRYLRKKTK
jgi:hypothetical protein